MCNFVRFAFACVGAVVDAVAPLKPVFGHPLPNPELERLKRKAETMTRLHEADAGIDDAVRLWGCDRCDGPLLPEHLRREGLCPSCYEYYYPNAPAVSATDAVEEPSPAGAPVPAGDVPHTIHGAPTFAVLQTLLTEYAVDHGELRFDGTADHWSCQCGQALPDGGDGAYAALRDHCIELQTSALSFAIAEARNTERNHQ